MRIGEEQLFEWKVVEKDAKIYVAGRRESVGSAIIRKLEANGYHNLLMETSQRLDLRSQRAVEDFFETTKPNYVFLAAAKVGGIQANNTNRAEFLYDNLMIEANVIHSAYCHKVKKLLFSAVEFQKTIEFDASKPDGTPQKLLDVSKLSDFGRIAATPLKLGIAKTYAWFLESYGDVRGQQAA